MRINTSKNLRTIFVLALLVCLMTQLNACATGSMQDVSSPAPLPASTDSATMSPADAGSATMTAVSGDPATMSSINVDSSATLTDKVFGYPVGNESLPEKYFNGNDDWIFLPHEGDLVKCKNDGSMSEVIYHEKTTKVRSVDLLVEDWVFFSVLFTKFPKKGEITKENRRGEDYFYFCKIKTDGTGFQKLAEEIPTNIYAIYDNMIYYLIDEDKDNDYVYRLYAMDVNGKNQRLLHDYSEENNRLSIANKNTNVEFQVTRDKIYAVKYVHSVQSNYRKLSKMNLDGSNYEEIFTTKNDLLNRWCIIDNTLYFINENENHNELYKMNLTGQEKTLLINDVKEYCINSDWIYFVSYAEPQKIMRIKADGSGLSLFFDGTIEEFSTVILYGVFQDSIYFATMFQEEGDDYYDETPSVIRRIKTDGSGLTILNVPKLTKHSLP